MALSLVRRIITASRWWKLERVGCVMAIDDDQGVNLCMVGVDNPSIDGARLPCAMFG